MVVISTQPMKNKKMLYILIPGTLIVWGLIILRIVNNMHSTTDTATKQNVILVPSEEIVIDTFSINPTYRDPFLGKTVQHHSPGDGGNAVAAKPVIPRQPAAITVPTPWPAITYNGIIKNQISNKEMVLLEINGQGYTMKVGETVNGVVLVKAFRDSVELLFSKEKKFIHK
jgi:hypothetical protein